MKYDYGKTIFVIKHVMGFKYIYYKDKYEIGTIKTCNTINECVSMKRVIGVKGTRYWGKRNTILSKINTLLGQRNTILGQRNPLLSKINTLLGQRKVLLSNRNM